MNAIQETSADRSSLARRRRRQLRKRNWIDNIVDEAKQLAKSLEGSSLADLHEHSGRLRQFVTTEKDDDDTKMLVLATAAVIEAVRRTLSLRLFDEQLHAGIIVSCGAVAEMQTGEGKTLAVALPAYVRALAGRGVHVATPNSYLAMRDHTLLAPVYSLLGMSTGLLQADASPEETRAAYRADITYGPAHSFGFDYLRDQLTLERFDFPKLGERIYSRLCGQTPEGRLLQRGLHASIVDEIDHVLIDDAVSPLLLSGSDQGESPDAEVHREAHGVAGQLQLHRDFVIGDRRHVRLTSDGFERVYETDQMVVHPHLVRPWHEYVVLALRASHCYLCDVHYVIRDDEVQIVDASTGRIYKDRSWSDGLQQAIESNAGLQISCETKPLARITRQRFYRYYESLGGMTGTATGCQREFATVYGLSVAVVPPRIASKRIMLPHHLSPTKQEKLAAIAEETETIIKQGRAVLIGTVNIAESVEVASELTHRGLTFELLNGVQDADEAAIVARAGQPGVTTVATNLAGRGTDIVLDPAVAQRGGLHVVVTQKHTLERVDRQLIGRCARCGDPGTARIYTSAEDELAQKHAPWIGRAIMRWDERGRSDELSLSRDFERIQVGQQRLATAHRWRLLQSERDDEKLFARSVAAPLGCCQI
jgi:preprotein translocase subunit SecA